jgi:type VI secretion system protein ImpB
VPQISEPKHGAVSAGHVSPPFQEGMSSMPKESIQKKISRVRPPRVHITYDVETGGAIEKRELPFVLGVLGDLAGLPDKPQPELKNRRFTEIDPDNFDRVLERVEPRLAFKVDNKLTDDDTKLSVELRFKKLEDFEPQNVVNQVEPLRKLLEERNRLANLRSSLYGNEKLEKFVEEILSNTDALSRLRTEMGLPETEGDK